MSDSNFNTTYIGDIYVIEPYNTQKETVQHWEQVGLERLDNCTGPEKRLYDLRQLKGISTYAMRMVVRMRSHPNFHLMNTAILTNSRLITDLVNSVLTVSKRPNTRIFTDKQDALTWLNERVPPEA